MTEIILGPPGTGKTTQLLQLVDDELTKGVHPSKIGFITFTKKGANEAVVRAKAKFKYSDDDIPYFRTIHSLCFRQLGLKSSDLLVGDAFKEFAAFAGISVTGRAWSDEGMLNAFEIGDRILFMENLARIRKIPLIQQWKEDDDGLNWNEVKRVATALIAFKKKRGVLDYTDMLIRFIEKAKDIGLKVLFVDESQDLSALQWEVVRLLASSCNRVVVAGDDDQAIFEWAGADVKQFVNMAGSTSVLGQSWRVPKAVQTVASRIITGVRHRRDKTWAARDEDGTVVHSPFFTDIDIAPTGTVLVLARNSYILKDQVEKELRDRGIVYEFAGRNSIDPGMVNAAAAWEDLKKKNITLAEARGMYKWLKMNTGVKRGYKKLEQFGDDDDIEFSMEDLKTNGGLLMDANLPWHEALERIPQEDISYMRAARRHGEKLRGGKPRVKLSTIHSIKGGEADHVIVMKEIAGRTYFEMSKSKLKQDEERRVWYVGVTRTKQRLSLVDSQTNRSCPWL